MSDGKMAEIIFTNNLSNKILRAKYMLKAIDIGSNAIRLVDDFFNFKTTDTVTAGFTDLYFHWTVSDLDRALDAMSKPEAQITVVSNATHCDVQYEPLKYENIGDNITQVEISAKNLTGQGFMNKVKSLGFTPVLNSPISTGNYFHVFCEGHLYVRGEK